MKKSIDNFLHRWQSWRNSEDLEEILRGPWNHWRRSFFLLALACMIFAFLPWLLQAPPLPSKNPKGILEEGRVGKAVPWGSTLFFYPGEKRFPSTPDEIFRFGEGSPLLAPLGTSSRRSLPPLPSGEVASFRGRIWTREQIRNLARAEQALTKQRSFPRGLLYLVLRRQIEEAWLKEEARLQGISLSQDQRKRLLLRHLGVVRSLRQAGFSNQEIIQRVDGLFFAASIRNLLPSNGLARFESEWVQRWSTDTSCRVPLPLCATS